MIAAIGKSCTTRRSCTKLKAYRPPRNHGQLLPTLHRGALPCGGELHWLKDQGIATVVDLTRRERPMIAAACDRLGLNYIKYPLSDADANPDRLRSAAVLVWNCQPCFFHCWHGRHRTGVTAALIRGRQGWAPDEILAEAQEFKFGDRKKHETLWTFICTELGATSTAPIALVKPLELAG